MQYSEIVITPRCCSRLAAFLLLAALPASFAPGEAVRASCGGGTGPVSLDQQVASAGRAFVGTVVGTDDDGRRAFVRVESIWSGPDLPASVEVLGSPVVGRPSKRGETVATSVDRRYAAGAKYLFLLNGGGLPLHDDSCTQTQPYTAEVAAAVPSTAHRPGLLAPLPPRLPNVGAGGVIAVARLHEECAAGCG